MQLQRPTFPYFFCPPDGLILSRSTDDDAVSLTTLSRPTLAVFLSELTRLLLPPSTTEAVDAYLIYAGLMSEGVGHWLLPTAVCTPTVLTDQLDRIAAANPKQVWLSCSPLSNLGVARFFSSSVTPHLKLMVDATVVSV